MTAILSVAIASTLLIWSFYVYVVSLKWDTAELNELEKVQLELAHILSLLESPDLRVLLKDESARQDLLLEFSACLKEDVLRLIKAGGLPVSSMLIAGVFLLSYYLIRFKARLISGRNDLQFLSGLTLVLFRSLK